MTPEEIIADLNEKNCQLMSGLSGTLSGADALLLMNKAAMIGFQMGSRVACSMLKGALLVQLMRTDKSKEAGK